jgi:hypothetical protein
MKTTDVSELTELHAQIQREMRAAARHLAAIRAEMANIEAAGMYDGIPTESWQSRNDSEPRYLYMYFRACRDGRGYEGPDGKRKKYVGVDPARQAEARRLADNRRRWEHLDDVANRLEKWLNKRRWDLDRIAMFIDDWPRVELEETQ